MSRREGFTLIELMVVIAIIAIIAAIAIPGLLQSQRASGERNASASMKTIASAQADFRSNDRDGNRITDYWTRDVTALFSLNPMQATGRPIKLIDISVACADAFALAPIAGGPTQYSVAAVTSYDVPRPKAGYWYYALLGDNSQLPPTPTVYNQDTDGFGAYHNLSAFGAGAYPEGMGTGRQIFIINERSVIYKRQTIQTVRQGIAVPPNAYPLPAGVHNGSTDDPNSWPTEANLGSNYGRLD